MACPFKNNRNQLDVVELVRHNYIVQEWIRDTIFVEFFGPQNTPYAGGKWLVKAVMPPKYPLEPPCLRVLGGILHPNICIRTGMVCMDLLEDEWNPKFTLVMVFDYFLPELLHQPNFDEPMYTMPWYHRIPEQFEKAVRRQIKKKHASNNDDILEGVQAMFCTE